MPTKHAYTRDVQTQLVMLGIDDTTLKHARAAWTMIEPQLPQMILEFFQHLANTGGAGQMANVNLERLRDTQFAYWRSLFAGAFDEAYQAQVDPIGSVHRKAGIGLSKYIAAYAWFSERFFNLIARTDPPPQTSKHAVFIATNKIIYLDMVLAAKSAEIVFVDL